MKCDKTETKIYKKRKCQKILKSGFVSEEDKKFLLELIKNHPKYDLKRIDGTETDFSYIECLNPRSKIQNIKTACRSAIAEDMMGISRKGYIAHHETPFINIFNLWIKDKDIDKINLNEEPQIVLNVEDRIVDLEGAFSNHMTCMANHKKYDDYRDCMLGNGK